MIDLAGRGLPGLPEKLPLPVIDAHTHLDATRRYSALEPDDALDLAAEVGVAGVVQVGCDAASSAWAVEFARTHRQVVASVGIHPNDAARLGAQLDAELAEIERLATSHDAVRAIGESGLDFFRTPSEEGRAVQRTSFCAHIALAKKTKLTLVIHDRDAHAEIADILDAEGWPEKVMFHCYSGDRGYARRVLAHGAFLSFPGNITYKANAELREVVAAVPADRYVVETDAPYLTPVPHRGKPNASYLIPHTVRYIAQVRGKSLETVCQELAANTATLFGGAWV